MEVHPPHHAIGSWREFFVHMATIVLGLLIALGLEQVAEGLHNRHLRHELQENMRAEAERNVKILGVHLDVNLPELTWYRSALTVVRTAVPKADSSTSHYRHRRRMNRWREWWLRNVMCGRWP